MMLNVSWKMMQTKYSDCRFGLIKGNRSVTIFQPFHLNNLALAQGTFMCTIYFFSD